MPPCHVSGWNIRIPSSIQFDLTWKDRVIGVLTHFETPKVEKDTDIRVWVLILSFFLSLKTTQYMLIVKNRSCSLRD